MAENRILRNTPVWIGSTILFFYPLLLLLFFIVLYGNDGVSIDSTDWILMVGYFISAFLLVWQRKLGWSLVIGFLFLSAAFGLFRSTQLSEGMSPLDYQFALAISNFIIIAYIFYFFRFPYLDGRDTGLFGIAHRFESKISGTINESVSITIRSLSISGVLCDVHAEGHAIKEGDKVSIWFEGIEKPGLTAVVTSIEEKVFRLKFQWLGFGDVRDLNKITKALMIQK